MEDFINKTLLPFICYYKHNKVYLHESDLSDRYIEYLETKADAFRYIRNKLIEYDIVELWNMRYSLPLSCEHRMIFEIVNDDDKNESHYTVYCNDCIGIASTNCSNYCDTLGYRFIYCKYCIKILNHINEKYKLNRYYCESNDVLCLQHICNSSDLRLFCDNMSSEYNDYVLSITDEEINMLTASHIKSAANV